MSQPTLSRRTPARLPLATATATALALLCASAAYGQTPTAEEASAATADAAPTELGTLTVTARRRDERLIDVPIAMNVVTGEQIDAMGLRNVVDVLNTTPGANSVDSGSSFTSVQIRGVSSSLGGNDNGYYIDETPFTGVSVPWYPDTRSFDIDRVEILKGPQGTLFGEGSMGGTVRILTRAPEFDAFRAGVELNASTTSGGSDGHGAKAYVNVPLADDRLALRVVATDETTPGWIDNAVTGQENVNDTRIRTWRGKLRFAPTDRWTIDLGYWKYRLGAQAPGTAAYDDMTFDSFIATHNEWDSTSLVSTWDFDGAQLVYSFADGNLLFPELGEIAPGLIMDAIIDIGVRTHELRLASTGDRPLAWTVGYYKREAYRYDMFVIPGMFNSDSTQNNDGMAVFGEATLQLPDPAWSLTAGLRYFKDDVDAIDIGEDGTTSILDASFDSWNPRLGLSYKPSDDATLYLTAARGFRSGQLQPVMSLVAAEMEGIELATSIDPDSIWTYELGMKSVLLQDRLLLEGALFYSDWDGVAVRVPLTPLANGLANSDGIRTRGAELSLAYTPVSALTLQLGGSYLDSTYKSDVPDTPFMAGMQVFNVPRTSLFAAFGYRWDVGQALQGVFSGHARHNTARRTAATSGTPGDAITTANLRVGLESPAGWGAYLYGDNLTNEDGAVTARNSLGAAGRLQPRTLGVLFRYDY